MLDLSYPPSRMTREDAEDVFQPVSRRFPSLRLLGMRRTSPSSGETLPAVSFATSPKMRFLDLRGTEPGRTMRS